MVLLLLLVLALSLPLKLYAVCMYVTRGELMNGMCVYIGDALFTRNFHLSSSKTTIRFKFKVAGVILKVICLPACLLAPIVVAPEYYYLKMCVRSSAIGTHRHSEVERVCQQTTNLIAVRSPPRIIIQLKSGQLDGRPELVLVRRVLLRLLACT